MGKQQNLMYAQNVLNIEQKETIEICISQGPNRLFLWLNDGLISRLFYLQGKNKCIYAMSVTKVLPMYELVFFFISVYVEPAIQK